MAQRTTSSDKRPHYAIAVRRKDLLSQIGTVQITQVGRRDMNNVVVVYTKAGEKGEERELQVWVRQSYTCYREAFRDAWIEAWGSALGNKLSKSTRAMVVENGYDVDHIFPRERAQTHGYEWLRVKELPKGLNRSWRNDIGAHGPLNDIYIMKEDDEVWNKVFMRERS